MTAFRFHAKGVRQQYNVVGKQESAPKGQIEDNEVSVGINLPGHVARRDEVSTMRPFLAVVNMKNK